MYGNSGGDTIDGGNDEDTLQGDAGQDCIYGGQGDDEIDGGDDDDRLFGQANNDVIYGQLGVDILDGGDNDDNLFGGEGNDVLRGGPDNDFIIGGDDLNAGIGNDSCVGGVGEDTLTGGDGDDELLGEDDNDTIYGNAGDDVLTGGGGTNLLDGGTGRDIIDGVPDADPSDPNPLAPVIDSLLASASQVLQGASLTLFAGGVVDYGATIQKVDFYRDDNDNGTLEIGAGDTSGLFVGTTFSVTVTGINDPPEVFEVGDVTANVNSEMVVHFDVWDAEDIPAATDPEDPYGDLIFSVDAGEVEGVSIDEDTGELTWTPTEDDEPGSPYPMTITVTDSDLATGQTTINVYVDPPVSPPELGPNLLTNRSFEQYEVTHASQWDIFAQPSPNIPGIPGWALDWTRCRNFELHELPEGQDPSGPFIRPADRDQYMELDADQNGHNPPDPDEEKESISMWQTIPYETESDDEYELSFAFAARPDTPSTDNVLEVHVRDDATGNELVTPANAPELDPNNRLTTDSSTWKVYTFTFTAQGTATTAYFADAGTNNCTGTYLDDVSVVAVPTVVSVEFLTKEEAKIVDPTGYGLLKQGKNPGGFAQDGSIQPTTDTTPGFGGGHQFFPGSLDPANPDQGNNVVRVRATVKGVTQDNVNGKMEIYFRSYDVDDPSTDKAIDSNGASANDNRGTLVINTTSDNQPGGRPGAPRRPSGGDGGFPGYLRPVNKGEDGKQTVGKWVRGQATALLQTDGKTFFAEVDLATSYNPGDNFRVAAAVSEEFFTDITADRVRTNHPKQLPQITSQLSVWRYVHIEKDTTNNHVLDLITPGTNRKTNRLADAYIEAETTLLNTPQLNTRSPQPTQAVDPNLRVFTVDPATERALRVGRDSYNHEKPVLWTAYVCTGFRQTASENLFGMTPLNQEIDRETSIIFAQRIRQTVSARPSFVDGQVEEAWAKTTVHEVGHQFGLNHYGTYTHVVEYYDASDEQKENCNWPFIHIMNADAVAVPMNNLANLPEVGSIDRFFFRPKDIATTRMSRKSPGFGKKEWPRQ